MRAGVTQHSEAWHEERRQGIGGSEAAAAVGLSPWLDPITLWAIKRGEEAPADSTLRMRIGNLVEPAIGALYSEETGRKLRHHSRQYVNPDYPFVRAHPDFSVFGERVLVQAKNAGPFAGEWGKPGAPDAIPIHYRLQGYHELAATGFDRVDFAVLSGGDDFGIWPLEWDTGIIDDLIEEEGKFWQHVLDGTMPEPSADSRGALAKRYPEATGDVKVASAEQEIVIHELLAAKLKLGLVGKEADRLENLVIAMIGDALAIEGAGHRVSYGNVKGSVRWKDVAAAAILDEETLAEFAERFRGASYRKMSVAKAGRSG